MYGTEGGAVDDKIVCRSVFLFTLSCIVSSLVLFSIPTTRDLKIHTSHIHTNTYIS